VNDSIVEIEAVGPFNTVDVREHQQAGLEWDTTCRTGRPVIAEKATGRELELFRDKEATFCPGDAVRISADLTVTFECGDKSRDEKDVSDYHDD
jgi:hypothetical protein